MLPQRQALPAELHPLETALINDITNHYSERALALIGVILLPSPVGDQSPPSLECVMERGSFLYHATVQSNLTVFWRLFSIQKDNPDIIFRKNPTSESNLFHGAAKGGNFSVIDDLVIAATKISETDIRYTHDFKYWLHADVAGMTPLMWAIQQYSYESAKKIISHIMKDDDETAVLHIKQVNNSHDNLLHFVFCSIDKREKGITVGVRSEDQIIRRGARFFNLLVSCGISSKELIYQNHQRCSPIYYFKNLTLDCQVGFFKQLNAAAKLIVLEGYHEYFKDNPASAGKEAYYRLAGLHSLKSYMIARLEFDFSLPSNNLSEQFLGHDISQIIPMFVARSIDARAQEKLAVQDASMLLADIDEIEKVVLDISGSANKELYFIFFAALFIITGSYCSKQTIARYNNDNSGSVVDRYALLLLSSPVTWDTMSLLLFLFYVLFAIYEVDVPRSKCASIVDKIDRDIMSRLHLLKGDERAQKSELINNLGNSLQQLKQQHHSSNVVGFFKHAQGALRRLHADVLVTKKPFAPSCVASGVKC